METKSELERVMEKRNRNKKDKERLHEEEAKKTPFQRVLEERAKRLDMLVRKLMKPLKICNINCVL